MSNLKPKPMYLTAFHIRINGMFRPILFEDVLYISASKNYSNIITASKGAISICVPLCEVEQQLLEDLICRIHRSYIISLRQITGYTYTHVYIGKKELPIGKTHLEDFMKRTIRIQSSRDRRMEEQIKKHVS